MFRIIKNSQFSKKQILQYLCEFLFSSQIIKENKTMLGYISKLLNYVIILGVAITSVFFIFTS